MKGSAMKRTVCCLNLLLILLVFSGCGQKEETFSPAYKPKGDLRASGAYRVHFGEPPEAAEGKVFAMVGYHPLAGQPGKITPFPLFMFTPDTPLQTVAKELLKWGEGWNVAKSPFPRGTKLLSITVKKDLARVELSEEALSGTDLAGQKLIIAVLAHTLVQSDEVNRVMVVAGGELLPFQAERGFFPDPADVVPPGPPRVLSVAGTWKKKKKLPEEVSVLFDRPVSAEKVDLFVEGKPLAGDRLPSAFDTAVAVRPSDPVSVQGGRPIMVAWRAADGMGRMGEGEEIFMLKRVEQR